MKKILLFLHLLFAVAVSAQDCDTLYGGVLERQFQTRIPGVIYGDGYCIKGAIVNGGLEMVGGTLSVIDGDTVGQVLRWTGTDWEPRLIIFPDAVSGDTSYNGITYVVGSPNAHKLGGTLTENTTISGVNARQLTFNNLHTLNIEAERTGGSGYTTAAFGSTNIAGFDVFHTLTADPNQQAYLRTNATTGNIMRLQSATNVQTQVAQYWDGSSHVTDVSSGDGALLDKTFRVTKSGIFALMLDRVGTFSEPGIMMYDTLTGEIRYQSPDILLPLANRPDSSFIKTSGDYWEKKTYSSIYRTGKTGFGTSDTTGVLNLSTYDPSGATRTWAINIIPPRKAAFSSPTFANGTYFDVSRIDINRMKFNHYTGLNHGVWMDQISVDSMTNLAVSKPGNVIRNTGFNVDGAQTWLPKWYWSTEQSFYPTGNSGGLDWEHHLEIFDTLGRQTRIVNYLGSHNGNKYAAGFVVNDFYIKKPFTTNYILRAKDNGEFYTDYPFTLKINNESRIAPIIERLHGAAFLNVLDWQPTGGRTIVGASGGIVFDNRAYINYSSGSTPKILSASGNLRIDSTEMYIKSVGGRHIRFESYGTSDYLDFGFDNNYFFINKNSLTQPFSIHKNARNFSFRVTSDGKTAFGNSAAFFDVDIFASTNSLGGSLGLRNEAQGWVSLKCDASKNFEIRNDQGSSRTHFLSVVPNSSRTGYLRDLAFVSDGTNASAWLKRTGDGTNTGWADIVSTISGGSNGRVSFFTSSNNITGDNAFFWDNTNKRLGIGLTDPYSKIEISGSIGAYTGSGSSLFLGDDNFRNATYYNRAPGLSAIYNAAQGVTSDLGIYSYNGSRRLVAIATENGRFGIGTTSPARTLHVEGTARITGSDTDDPVGLVARDADGDIRGVVLDGLAISGGTISLQTTGVTAGTYGTESTPPIFTVGADGRITSASTPAFVSDTYTSSSGGSSFTWQPLDRTVFCDPTLGDLTIELNPAMYEGVKYTLVGDNNLTNDIFLTSGSTNMKVSGTYGYVSTYTLSAAQHLQVENIDGVFVISKM